MTRYEAIGLAAAFRYRLDDTRYIFDEISAGMATKVEYQNHIEMRKRWQDLIATLESGDVADIDFGNIEKELNDSYAFEQMPKANDESPSYEDIVETVNQIDNRTDTLESTTDDMILLMAELIGGE